MESLNAAFSRKCIKSLDICFDNARISQAGFQAKKSVNEDKTVFLESQLGLIVALFDGHHSDDLADYASKTLPPLLLERIQKTLFEKDCTLDEAVVTSFIQSIEEYDRWLIQGVIDEFPQKDQTDWSDPFWEDEREVFSVLGWLKEHPKFQRARYAVVGTTALIAFIDRAKENVWVASLGDSDAFLGQKREDGVNWEVTCLSDYHNGQNPDELERVQREHPGEPQVIQYGRILSCLAVTRALGNHQLKTPYHFAKNILRFIWPSPFPMEVLDNCTTPPYISATAVVRRHSLKLGDILVLSSEGLAYELRNFDEDNKKNLIISFSMNSNVDSFPENASWSEKLGHQYILAQDGDNPAERVIKNVCFGTDLEKMAEAVNPSEEWDDISVLVLQL
ncbi:phosphatase 2C-like domain-containing protein [Lentinula edodes]|uniref:phosphatase 2C-like domain-containing protein n=1 Tax=Lentinula edodes TaxID=5353 RepID=UPI001E8D2954|nr:phosphatase 2C-like domain-containing protein [Lentinula edodes]KAH7872128.1 phosphatase 2C-like domain-containing protein [Lentinula edodes]